MFQQIRSYIREIPAIAAIDCFIGPGDTLVMHVVVLEQRFGKVETLVREYDLTDISALKALLPEKVPLAVSISGVGVMHRIRPLHEDLHGNAGDSQALMNWDKSDFMIQQLDLDGTHIRSAIRPAAYQAVSDRMQSLEREVLFVGLGPFAVIAFATELQPDPNESIQVGMHTFGMQDGQLTGYRINASARDTQALSIGGEPMNAKLIPAFSLALGTLMALPVPMLDDAAAMLKLEEHRSRASFLRVATASGIFLLVLLLLNTGLYLYLNDRVVAEQLPDGAQVKSRIAQLQQQVAARDQLLFSLGLDRQAETPGMSVMADRLAATVPTSIALRTLSFFPADDARSQKGRKPVLMASTVHLEGVSETLSSVTAWVGQLRAMDFCTQVTLDSYVYDERREEGMFKITVNVDD